MKKQRTPEQKEKLNKKLFGIFMSLVFLACIGIGIYRGVYSLPKFDITNFDAFERLKNDSYTLTTILGSVAKIPDGDLNNISNTSLISTLEGAGLDYYTAGSLDEDKWATPQSASDNYTLIASSVGKLIQAFYSNVRGLNIELDSANKYTITIVEFVRLHAFITNKEYQGLLPEYAYVTSQSVVHVDNGVIKIDSAKVRAYNELNQDRSDVITSVLRNTSTNIENYSINNALIVLNALAQNSNTIPSFDGNSVVYTMNNE